MIRSLKILSVLTFSVIASSSVFSADCMLWAGRDTNNHLQTYGQSDFENMYKKIGKLEQDLNENKNKIKALSNKVKHNKDDVSKMFDSFREELRDFIDKTESNNLTLEKILKRLDSVEGLSHKMDKKLTPLLEKVGRLKKEQKEFSTSLDKQKKAITEINNHLDDSDYYVDSLTQRIYEFEENIKKNIIVDEKINERISSLKNDLKKNKKNDKENLEKIREDFLAAIQTAEDEVIKTSQNNIDIVKNDILATVEAKKSDLLSRIDMQEALRKESQRETSIVISKLATPMMQSIKSITNIFNFLMNNTKHKHVLIFDSAIRELENAHARIDELDTVNDGQFIQENLLLDMEQNVKIRADQVIEGEKAEGKAEEEKK